MSKVVWTEGEHVAYVLAKQSEDLEESDLGRWFLDASKAIIILQKEGVQFRDALPDLSDDQCRHVVGMGDRFAVMIKNELGKEVKEGIERRVQGVLSILIAQLVCTKGVVMAIPLVKQFAVMVSGGADLTVMAMELVKRHGLDEGEIGRMVSAVDWFLAVIFGAESQE